MLDSDIGTMSFVAKVEVENCDEADEGICSEDATDCKVQKVRRCETVKDESCSDIVTKICEPDLENCDVPECKGPERKSHPHFYLQAVFIPSRLHHSIEQ